MGSENGGESRCGEGRRWRAKVGGCGERERWVWGASRRAWRVRMVGGESENGGWRARTGGYEERERVGVENGNGRVVRASGRVWGARTGGIERENRRAWRRGAGGGGGQAG